MKLLSLLLLSVIVGQTGYAQIYASSLDKKPAAWKGPVFKLHAAYPKKLPKEKTKPWLQFDFKTQPKAYINAVLQYFLEGNTAIDFAVQQNKKRKWWHAPSMSWQPGNRPFGREFIHGLTRERNSPAKELHPSQQAMIQNWAVGFYNAAGAFTFGQVWADTNNLQPVSVSFPEGTVSVKLLFTAATPAAVPYLKGAFRWKANINTQLFGTTARSPQTVRLLQVDIAVKDKRADEFTGWVFGTFAYHAEAPGNTVWKRLVPVGLMWGNDPDKTEGQPLEQTWINPDFIRLFRFPDGSVMHTGYQGRLNGPVDNPESSCLSCHATAQLPQFKPMIPSGSPAARMKFFGNLPSGQPFDSLPGSRSMDYSLQLSGGLAAAIANRSSDNSRPDADAIKKINYFITSMEDSLQKPVQPAVDPAQHSNAVREGSKAIEKGWLPVLLLALPGLAFCRWWLKA
jgi:hypothetical protein